MSRYSPGFLENANNIGGRYILLQEEHLVTHTVRIMDIINYHGVFGLSTGVI